MAEPTAFNPQSSSNLTGSVNPMEGILFKGEVTFACDNPVSGGFTGQGSVDLDQFQASVLNPEVEAYLFVDNGAPTYSRSLAKAPHTNISYLTGVTNYVDSVSLFWDQLGDGDRLQLLISAWSATEFTARYFYIIKRNSITNSNVFSLV